MTSQRSIARIAGALFIIATAASIIGTGLSRSLLEGPERLTALSASVGRVTVGAFLELVAAGASAGIAIAMYPVLVRWGPARALGSVVFRGVEAVMYAVAVVGLLSLLAMSRTFTIGGAADPESLRLTSEALLALRDEATFAGVVAFALGALMYYSVFYGSRLIPRWLSVWGLAAIVLFIATWTFALFTGTPLLSYAVLAIPIAVQEMVLAVWLIARGFDAGPRPALAI